MNTVVDFYRARQRLRPFANFSELWLQAHVAIALRDGRWRPLLAELRAELQRREHARRRSV